MFINSYLEEFPGLIAEPVCDFHNRIDYNYQSIRCNVDLSKVIQIGFTFFDSKGRTPDGFTTWQFNFKFDLTKDIIAEEAVQLLTKSGVQFERLATDGIDSNSFAELLMTSGIVLSDNVKWISFHGSFDFAHLIKLLTDQNLPSNVFNFLDLLKIYFPIIYDIKYLLNRLNGFSGGLQEVSHDFKILFITII